MCVQYHEGYHEYRGGYHEYCGGYHDARGGCSVLWGGFTIVTPMDHVWDPPLKQLPSQQQIHWHYVGLPLGPI